MVLMGLTALTAYQRRGRLVLGAKVITVIILVTLLPGIVSGCASGTSRAESTARTRATPNGQSTTLGIGMLAGMHDKAKIHSMSEAAAAYERANETRAAVVTLSKEANRSGISASEHARKNREIERLREQYIREMEPVNAFLKEVEREVNKR